jgi:hypothetical protein
MPVYNYTISKGKDLSPYGVTSNSSWASGYLDYFIDYTATTRLINLSSSDGAWGINTVRYTGNGRVYIYDTETISSSYGNINYLQMHHRAPDFPVVSDHTQEDHL